MERITQILTITTLDQIPSFDHIRELPRNIRLKLVFDESTQNNREAVGERLKNGLKGFLIGVHVKEPFITIAKLITNQEIVANQLFFEKCAKDYRAIAQELINEFADKLKVVINPDIPMQTFQPLKNGKRQRGKMDGWEYFLHGGHCAFTNKETGQYIEVCLLFGREFGDLDPCFFSGFIKSTPKYQPLPVNIYEDYHDGFRINEVMLSLGKFEKINPGEGNHGIVVTDRNKFEEYKLKDRKKGFDFWRFIGIK